MNLKQKLAIVTPPILVAVMYPVFHSLAGVMELYLSFLAKKRNTVWWGIVVHTVGGIIMVV